MKLRDAPTLSRRFRFAGSEDVYILVTPKCWPSPVAAMNGQTPRPALYVQVGWSKSADDTCEGIHEFVTPRPTPEHVAAFCDFAEAETHEERERAAEIWSRLVAWHGKRAQEKR